MEAYTCARPKPGDFEPNKPPNLLGAGWISKASQLLGSNLSYLENLLKYHQVD